MCLLSYFPSGVMPDGKELLNGMEVNDEGAGYGIFIGGELQFSKSIDMQRMFDEFMLLREEHPDGAAVFHARLSTDSAIRDDLCHPFVVGRDPRTIVFHNGSLPIGHADKSDTQWLAEDYLPAQGSWATRANRRVLERWAGPNNKIIVMSSNPVHTEAVYIINRDQFFVTPAGALHSNADFLGHGEGWEEGFDSDGEWYRWNIPQPGQCPDCFTFHSGETHPAPVIENAPGPRYRNEGERLLRVHAATVKGVRK